MSLYHMVMGIDRLAAPLLHGIGLTTEDVGRFRDCYLSRGDDGELYIDVFTRNGGGNREEHEDVTRILRAHPQFHSDFDDDFDSTYATYRFHIPEEGKEPLAQFVAEHPDVVKKPYRERFQEALDKLAPTKE